MNITFLIGNGFDLNLGLPTGYTDFIKYHREQGLTDMISMAIRDDYQAWSNVESTLGEFTANVNQENLEEFADSKCSLDESLSDYLTYINETHTLTIADDGPAEFRNKLLNLSKEFNETDRSIYNSVVMGVGESVQYGFVSFNYTDYLDRIVSITKNLRPFNIRKIGNSNHSDCIKDPIHVHGKLDGNVLLGVNDDSQIHAPDDIKRQISALMVKPEMNTSLGERRTEHAKELILSSRYVLVYGMSLGKTDAMWWEFLAGWLKDGSSRRLVLYTYSPSINQKSASRTVRWQNAKRNEFLRAANCTDTTISKQIIIIPNTKVFTFDSISISPATPDERTEAV